MNSPAIAALQKSKLALVTVAIAVAHDHFNIEISTEDSRLFGLAVLSRFHQKDGRGGGHVLLSAAEAFEAMHNLSPQEKQRLEEIDQTLRTATAHHGVTPSTIVDMSLWRLARDSDKHINFPDIQAPGDAFLSIKPLHDLSTGKHHIINVVDPILFRVRTLADEYAYFIDEQVSRIRQNFGEHAPYGPRINAHDIVHSLAQEFAPNAELSVGHFDNYAPNATIQGNYYQQDKPDLSFAAFKKAMKPSFQDDSYRAMGTGAQRLALLAGKGSQFLEAQDLADDEKLFYLGGDAPSAERFELAAAYLESQLLVRADPHDLASAEGQPFNALSAAARLEKLSAFWEPQKSRATTIALPDGSTLPYPAQPMTTLQENAILAQIAKTLMYQEFLEKYIENSNTLDSPPPKKTDLSSTELQKILNTSWR